MISHPKPDLQIFFRYAITKIVLINKKIHDRLLRIIFFRIGLGIAKKLVSDGAKVMISSRKASNVEEALKSFPEKEISGLK